MRAHLAGKLGEGATAVTGAELCERLFQSTPPARGATRIYGHLRPLDGISIHAPPRGGRRGRLFATVVYPEFQSTPPREGGDCRKAGK